jgi:hypothetical protein
LRIPCRRKRHSHAAHLGNGLPVPVENCQQLLTLSGSFVPLKDLALDVDKEKEKERKATEESSVEIVREILAKDIHTFAPRLL